MIYTRLHGRLGNQMFQYAAARALAARHGVPVALDPREALRRKEGVLTRVFDLPVAEPGSLPPNRHNAPLRYLVWRYVGLQPRFRREQGLGFNTEIEEWGDGSYLHGYWQSERYFADSAEQLRRDFRFPAASAPNTSIAGRIARANSVSLHVRRGDYLTFGAHGVCGQSYYRAALGRIIDRLSDQPTVFVFSDDPDWARDNLELPCDRFVVDINGPDADFEDMHLMSLCRHNIIANSSFSWWAAWLNPYPDKIVVGPARWFSDAKLHNPDILPQTWLSVAEPTAD